MTPGLTGPKSRCISYAGTAQARQLPTMTARSSPRTGPGRPAGGTNGAGGLVMSRPGLAGGPCRRPRVPRRGPGRAAAADTAAAGSPVRLPAAARRRTAPVSMHRRLTHPHTTLRTSRGGTTPTAIRRHGDFRHRRLTHRRLTHRRLTHRRIASAVSSRLPAGHPRLGRPSTKSLATPGTAPRTAGAWYPRRAGSSGSRGRRRRVALGRPVQRRHGGRHAWLPADRLPPHPGAVRCARRSAGIARRLQLVQHAAQRRLQPGPRRHPDQRHRAADRERRPARLRPRRGLRPADVHPGHARAARHHRGRDRWRRCRSSHLYSGSADHGSARSTSPSSSRSSSSRRSSSTA